MTRKQGFVGGALLWSVPIALWWIAIGMAGTEDIITYLSKPIPPLTGKLAAGLTVLFGALTCLLLCRGRDAFEDEPHGFTIVLALTLVWFGAVAGSFLAIADNQADLIAEID